jgi:hypothetical protein
LDWAAGSIHPEACDLGSCWVLVSVAGSSLPSGIQEGWEVMIKRLWKSFVQMVEDYAYWAEFGKNCYVCMWRYSPEVMVDFDGEGHYTCPKCSRKILEWCDYEV